MRSSSEQIDQKVIWPFQFKKSKIPINLVITQSHLIAINSAVYRQKVKKIEAQTSYWRKRRIYRNRYQVESRLIG